MTTPCIVLAGGLGTRLRSAVPDLPKCLAPIQGRPFLEWQLRSLAQRGVSRFVLALGHGADQVQTALSQDWAKSLQIDYVIEREALGTGGATRFAMKETGLDEALVVNGDTYLGGNLAPMHCTLDLAKGERMRIATVGVSDRTRFGGVELTSHGCITTFLEKGQSGPGIINAGLYRVHSSAFDSSPGGAFSMETLVMPQLLVHGALWACELAGPFIDIGVPDDYRQFSAHVEDYVNAA